MGRICKIKWSVNDKDVYMYGSNIRLKGDCISFANRFMPSGETVIKWGSPFSLCSNKKLPMLEAGKVYYLDLKYFTNKPGSCYCTVLFYDMLNNIVRKQVFHKSGQLKVPKSYAYYTLELMQGGFSWLEFYYIDILDYENSEPKQPAINNNINIDPLFLNLYK